LHKVSSKARYDVVVIDESEQVLGHFLSETMDRREGAGRERLFVGLIVITSDTVVREDVQDFIANVKTKALEYDVIITSPSLGTGVDISFPDKARLIDTVYGFFEAQVTTHLECDQQLARVRNPGAVKVWLNSRRFNYETNKDVIRRDLLRQGLYKNLLKGYSEGGEPQYDEEDEFLLMAVLIVAERRASMNNLRRNFIKHKKRQGPPWRSSRSTRTCRMLGRTFSSRARR
jgi:hypothetical protein